MKIIRPLFMVFLLLNAGVAFGQWQRTFHQSVPLTDSIEWLELTPGIAFDTVRWPGNGLMSETTIRLFNASEGITKFVVEQGRYNWIFEQEGPRLRMNAQQANRPVLQTTRGPIGEELHLRIFIPEGFDWVEAGLWQRRKSAPDMPKETSGGGR